MSKDKIRLIITVVCLIGIAITSWSMASALGKEDYNDLGLAAYEDGNYDEAIEYYTKAIELEPKNAIAYNYRGLAYFQTGLWFVNREPFYKAIPDYTKAIELNPKYVDAYYNRGVAYNQLFHCYSKVFPDEDLLWGKDFEKYNKALVDLDRVLELDPMYALAYAGKGEAYFRIGELNKAIEEYSKTLKSEELIKQRWGSEALAKVYAARGRTYRETKEFDKSILDYNEALELNLKIELVLGPQAANYLALKQPGKALEYFDATIALIESDPEKYSSYGYFRYMQRGMCYYQLKQYDKAISDFKKVIGFRQPADTIMMGQNSYIAMYKMLGIVYLETGDKTIFARTFILLRPFFFFVQLQVVSYR